MNGTFKLMIHSYLIGVGRHQEQMISEKISIFVITQEQEVKSTNTIHDVSISEWPAIRYSMADDLID